METNLLFIPRSIDTLRLTLRRFQEGEGKAFYDLVKKNERHLQDFPTTLGKNRSSEASEIYMQKSIANWLLQKVYLLAICEKGQEGFIGMINIFDLKSGFRTAEIAYFLDESVYGKGYMTEAVRHALDFCFNSLKMEKMYLRTIAENSASQNVARKTGFVLEGKHKQDFRMFNERIVDIYRFGLTKEDYFKQL